jgi:hypothetical protein
VANRSAQLYLYARLPGIGWRYCPPVFGANNKPKSHFLLRPDEVEEHHPEADYYLGRQPLREQTGVKVLRPIDPIHQFHGLGDDQ